MSKNAVKQTQSRLVAEKARLERELVDLRQSLQAGWDYRSDDGDTAAMERERTLAVAAILRRKLEDVHTALHAMEKGQYGVCKRCGEPIGAERLQVRPDAVFCLACQQAIEANLRRGR